MSSPISTSFFPSIAVNIANSDQWANGHDMELSMGSKRCHMKPALQYTTTGLIPDATYNVQLKIEQLKKLKMKFLMEKNRYVEQSKDHEAKTCQFVDLPGVPGNSWISGKDLKVLDFSKVFFTKQSAPGEVRVRPLIRYQPTVVIRDSNGIVFEFGQPSQTIIPISGKKKIQYHLPPVPMEGEEEKDDDFDEPPPKRRAEAREFGEFTMASSSQVQQPQVVFNFDQQYAHPHQIAPPQPTTQLTQCAQLPQYAHRPLIAEPPQFDQSPLPTAPPKRRRQFMNPSNPYFPHMDMMDYRGFTEEETIAMYQPPPVLDTTPAPPATEETPSVSDDIVDKEIIDNEDYLSSEILGFDEFLHADGFYELMDKLDREQEDVSSTSCQ